MDVLTTSFTLPLRTFVLSVDLKVYDSLALVGPSGAGKTSVLRAVAGLLRPADGRIALGDDVWFDSATGLFRKPDERRVGLVFQEYALFPHMTVRQNVAYGGQERVDEYLERFRISHLARARPTQLSGGERQRVALARALARDPGVLLLDEPLSALDAHTKVTVRGELQELLREAALPTVIVTHDYEDAAALADRVGVIVDGTLRQLARPPELVSHPADGFVAAFTGANLLRGGADMLRGGTNLPRGGADMLRGGANPRVLPHRVIGPAGPRQRRYERRKMPPRTGRSLPRSMFAGIVGRGPRSLARPGRHPRACRRPKALGPRSC